MRSLQAPEEDSLGKAMALHLPKKERKSQFGIYKDLAEQTVSVINECGSKAVAMVVDITFREMVEDAAKNTIFEFGKVDVLVNNAGIVSTQRSILELSDEQWAKEINVNLTGTFYCTRSVLGHMIEKRSGKIINIASLAGETGRILTSAAYKGC